MIYLINVVYIYYFVYIYIQYVGKWFIYLKNCYSNIVIPGTDCKHW